MTNGNKRIWGGAERLFHFRVGGPAPEEIARQIEIERQIEIARQVMVEDREFLHELAKR
jgi:hypothetical protein